MTQFVVAFLFFVVGFGFMALMLQLARYKKRKSSCCGDILEDFEKGEDCDTCPNRDNDECTAKEALHLPD